MSPSQNPSASQRTREILQDLEAVRENLLALSDDIWDSIDRQGVAAFDEGVQFMRIFIERMAAFDQLAAGISELVQRYTSVRLESEEQSGVDDREKNDRIVRELNREQPHSIDENFTFKRPHGFILDGQAATGITTWRRLFELLCQQLLRRDRSRFQSLPENPDFISNRGHRAFTRKPDELRHAGLIGNDIHAEINLSANSIRDTIRRLLDAFEIPHSELKLFLREDRDAGNAD